MHFDLIQFKFESSIFLGRVVLCFPPTFLFVNSHSYQIFPLPLLLQQLAELAPLAEKMGIEDAYGLAAKVLMRAILEVLLLVHLFYDSSTMTLPF